MTDKIRVLHVDDEPEFVHLASELLERDNDRFQVITATEGEEALTMFDEHEVHCVISDYDMPRMDGIELLEAVRVKDQDIPFILFTGKGSETVASRAFAAEATDYLQKGGSTEQFTVLANRVENAVDRYIAEQQLTERTRRLETLISNLPGIVYRCANEPSWPMESVEGDCLEMTGYPCEAFIDGPVEWGEDIIHPDDRSNIWMEVQRAIENGGSFEVTYRVQTRDNSTKWMWEQGRAIDRDNSAVGLVVEGFITDITNRKRQQERLRVLFEDADDAVVEVTFEGDTAVIGAVNPAFEQTFGVQQAAVIGKELNAVIVPEDDLDLAYELDSRVKAGEIVEEELLRQTATGMRWFLLRTVPFTFHGEHRAFATYVDISEQKAREDALQRLHRATQSMFNTTDIDQICDIAAESVAEILSHHVASVYLFDQQTNELEPIAMTTIDDRVENVSPSSIDEQTTLWELYAEGSVQVIEDELPDVVRALGLAVDPPSALAIPLGGRGIIISASTVPRRFTDTEIQLAALLASATETALNTARWEHQLTNLHDAATSIGAAETESNIFDLIIEAAEDILEFDLAVADAFDGSHLVTRSTSMAIGQSDYYDTTSIDDETSIGAKVYRRQEPEITDDLLDTEAAPADPTFRSALTLPLGEHGVFQAAARQPHGFDAKDLELAELLTAHAREALARLERTDELKQRSRALNRQNNRLEKFASIVSHDLRNPLNVATGQLALASEECDSRHLREVSVALKRMDSLINDTLTLARQGRTVAERETISLSGITEGCWHLIEARDASLVIEDEVQFLGDPERIKQVFENLFRNAVEHGGDDVTIRVCLLEPDGISIEDDGPGISATERSTVFDSPTGTSGESGLGLAIVKEIIDAHGWDIEVTQGESKGARFEITGMAFVDES